MQGSPTRHIGINLGNLGSLHDGLGEFSLLIGRCIAAAAPPWRERKGVEFDFHLRDRLTGLFGMDMSPRIAGSAGAMCSWFATISGIRCTNSTRTFRRTVQRPRVVTVHDLNYLYHPSAFSRWRHDRRTRADSAVPTTGWSSAPTPCRTCCRDRTSTSQLHWFNLHEFD